VAVAVAVDLIWRPQVPVGQVVAVTGLTLRLVEMEPLTPVVVVVVQITEQEQWEETAVRGLLFFAIRLNTFW
jgi:hypothetical protein